MRTIAVLNQKGGVAKTTTAHHLGVALAQAGHATLLVDLDPQAVLTFNCGYRLTELQAGIETVLAAIIADRQEVGVREIAVAVIDNLDLAPTSHRLAAVRDDLHRVTMGREFVLREALGSCRYDFILIDCPPSLDDLSVNALAAATDVLIPVSTEPNSIIGLAKVHAMIAQGRKKANPTLNVLGIVPTIHRRREVISRGVLAALATDWPEYHLFPPIPRSADFTKASGARTSLMTFAPDSPGAVAYRTIVKEMTCGPA